MTYVLYAYSETGPSLPFNNFNLQLFLLRFSDQITLFFLNFELSYSTLQVFFYRLHAKIQLNTNYVGFEVRKRNGRGLVEFLKARNGLTRFSAKFYDKVVGNKDDKDLQHKLKQKKIFFDEIRSKLTHLCSKYKVFFNLKY